MILKPINNIIFIIHKRKLVNKGVTMLKHCENCYVISILYNKNKAFVETVLMNTSFSRIPISLSSSNLYGFRSKLRLI